MSAGQWILLLLLGGLLGVIGQGVRVVVGLKKVHDQATQQNRAFADLFEWRKLLVSLLIGFVAGALASIAATPDDATAVALKKRIIIGLMAAGYAGTDFIEGFMKKYLPAR